MVRNIFVTGGRYRHDLCLDIDILVQKVRFVGPNYVVANVIYINRNWDKGNFPICAEKNVKFVKEHFQFWKRVATP